MKLKGLRDWYERREAHISTATLVGGFIFDSLTLTKIDSVWDNAWIIINLLSIVICLVLINRVENDIQTDESSWRHFWLFNVLQFSFGAVLGASFIFYFRSATLAVSWPFIIILLLAMLANEYWKKHYQRLVFQVTFLFFSIYIFSIFFLPLLLHRIGAGIFLLSGALSLGFVASIILILRKMGKEKFKKSWTPLWRAIFGVFITINLLYFTNLIPPIPLSLKDAGIYHSIMRDISGEYLLVGGEENWFKRFFKFRQEVKWDRVSPIYAYTAIYAPGSLHTQIIHEWQRKDEQGEWETATRVPLSLNGGRAGGFRTYSEKKVLAPGLWRVNVTTPRGQVLGRINFEII